MPSKTSYTSGIYFFQNIITKRKYIGSSIDTDKRIACHLNKLRQNKHQNKDMQKDFNSIGEAGFIYGILELVFDPAMLFNRESYYISKETGLYNTGVIAVKIDLSENDVLRFLKGITI